MEQGHLEKDPEPGDKEHDFRSNEQDHAIAQADRHNGGMIPGIGFLDDFQPPADKGVDHPGKAQGKQPPGALFQTKQALHPDHPAYGHDHGGK